MRNRSNFARAVSAATLCSFVVTSCGGKSAPPVRAPAASPISDRVLVQTQDLPPGLDMRVSQGKQGAPAFDQGKLAPAKRISGPIPADPNEQQARGANCWWSGPWYEHQNLRDDRVEAFASPLWEGVHEYSYVARATTRGNFVVPPPKAERCTCPRRSGVVAVIA